MRRDAVVVGIDNYPGAGLAGCVNDANEFAACIALPEYNFNTQEVLLNSMGTRSQILESLGKLCFGNDDGEFLLFYFAGHGQVLGNSGYLVTRDATAFDPGISLTHLASLMESASKHYRHVLAILDCCHAGSALTWSESRPLSTRDVEREIHALNESRCVLAACRPEQVASELFGHGIFTAALVDGLLGNAVDFDGNVTVFGLHDYVAKVMKHEKQTPVFKGDAAGTVIVGSGHEPRVGRPIQGDELKRTLAKAQAFVDDYHFKEHTESSDWNRRKASGARECARLLEPTLAWFHDTEREMPDIVRNPKWIELRTALRNFQGHLADIRVGMNLLEGQAVRLIGKGGYGQVWEIALADGTTKAYKVFHGNELDDVIKVQRFANGFKNMRELEHPQIVRVTSLTTSPYGFLMDYIPGENLRSYIDRSDVAQCLRLMCDIVETVQHAHSRGVIHRDIKPENIIVVMGPNGELTPFLTDFDLAYHETNRTMTTNLGVGGVINYAAPEQLYAPNTAAARAETVDVFSLSQLMFFVITGADPVADDMGRNASVLRTKLGEWVEVRAADLLLDLYVQSSDRDPSLRPASVTDFFNVLNEATTYALAATGRDDVDEDQFCRQFGHLVAGMGNYAASDDKVSMLSLSRQVSISLRFVRPSSRRQDHGDFELELSVTADIPVRTLSSGSGARKAINTRLDKAIHRFEGTRRHSGTKGSFQTFVEVNDVPLTLQGLAHVQKVLSVALAAIEQW